VHSFIDEIFLDSRAEIDLCISASKLVVQECWYDVEIYLDKLAKSVTVVGIGFILNLVLVTEQHSGVSSVSCATSLSIKKIKKNR
jgi:hypothetical protein